jgi:hypothetical protein
MRQAGGRDTFIRRLGAEVQLPQLQAYRNVYRPHLHRIKKVRRGRAPGPAISAVREKRGGRRGESRAGRGPRAQ